MKTVQTFFGTKPFGANTPVGTPIPASAAIQVLNNLSTTHLQCHCMNFPDVYFGYDVVTGKTHVTFEIICDIDCNTKMPCKYIGLNAIRALPTSKKIQECIKRASAGKCADEFMRTNVWSVIFANAYSKQIRTSQIKQERTK